MRRSIGLWPGGRPRMLRFQVWPASAKGACPASRRWMHSGFAVPMVIQRRGRQQRDPLYSNRTYDIHEEWPSRSTLHCNANSSTIMVRLEPRFHPKKLLFLLQMLYYCTSSAVPVRINETRNNAIVYKTNDRKHLGVCCVSGVEAIWIYIIYWYLLISTDIYIIYWYLFWIVSIDGACVKSLAQLVFKNVIKFCKSPQILKKLMHWTGPKPRFFNPRFLMIPVYQWPIDWERKSKQKVYIKLFLKIFIII